MKQSIEIFGFAKTIKTDGREFVTYTAEASKSKEYFSLTFTKKLRPTKAL